MKKNVYKMSCPYKLEFDGDVQFFTSIEKAKTYIEMIKDAGEIEDYCELTDIRTGEVIYQF